MSFLVATYATYDKRIQVKRENCGYCLSPPQMLDEALPDRCVVGRPG